MRRWFRIAWIAAGLGSIAWLVNGIQVTDLPDEMFRAMPEISIERYTTESRFTPKNNPRGVNLLFYPGAMVDPLSYDPLARRIARAGYPVVVLHLPIRIAFGSHVDEMMSRTLEKVRSGRWALAGHSRGAVLAATFAHLHPERVAGLVLVGTTHPRDFDLSSARFPVTKIMASRDGVAPVAQSRANQGLLPPTTRFVMIEGGNHAQFGYYRYQLFDGEAIISREEQQQQLTGAMLAALDEIEKKPQ